MVAMRTWQELVPFTEFAPGPLAAVERILAEPEVERELAACELAGRFPASVVDRVQAAGLAQVFVGWDVPATATFAHVASLGAIAAQTSGSLAITLGIPCLALLPVYLAGSEAQRALVRRRLEGGATAAMLLSEMHSGSNLLAIGTRASAVPGGAEGVPAGYRLEGEKQIINLVRRADVLMTLARTSEAPRSTGLGATAGLSLLLVERDASVENLGRWETSPTPAADIGGVRFHGTEVPAAMVVGGEGDGFGLVQRSLSISRGGICAFAAGTSNRALGLALQHGRERILYGAPILKLDAIAEHLVRMAAWDLGATCVALNACAAVTALGLRAAHHTAVAKLVACDLAERAVAEGRAVLAARGLLTALPYQQVARDVLLYGIFDGTRHVMLDQIQWRLRQMGATPAAAERGDEASIYASNPRSILTLAEGGSRPRAPRPSARAERLASIEGVVDLGPVVDVARGLEALCAGLPPEAWKTQSLAFALAEVLGGLEAALSVAELADAGRRIALGARPRSSSPLPLPAELLARYTVCALAAGSVRSLRTIALGLGLEAPLGGVEATLTRTEATTAADLRAALRDSL